MLDSLEIKNFRNLKHLQIESLGAVNLIIGKNNTGKSSILEAIMIYASKGDLKTIYEILDNRGENYKISDNANPIEVNTEALSSLFTNRMIDFNADENALQIGPIDKIFELPDSEIDKFFSLRFLRYRNAYNPENNEEKFKRILISDNEIEGQLDYLVGFEIKLGTSILILPLDKENPHMVHMAFARGKFAQDNCHFVKTIDVDIDSIGLLWDNIILSEKEDYVIQALNIIDKDVEGIAFIKDASRSRKVLVKVKNTNKRIPLKSMGDGINRILTIILALVNADNGYLLIDEFENGLHHSVQKQLWEIVFFLSKKLKVQVFATTHSEDCIKGFESVLNSNSNDQAGKVIRLALKNGIVSLEEFDAKELELAIDNKIEIR